MVKRIRDGIYRTDFRNSEGSRIRKLVEADDLAMAKRIELRMRLEANVGAPPKIRGRRRFTIADAAREELERARQRAMEQLGPPGSPEPASNVWARTTLPRYWDHIKRVFGETRPVALLEPRHMQMYFDFRHDEGLAADTIKREIRCLLGAAANAVNRGVISSCPALQTKTRYMRGRQGNRKAAGKLHENDVLRRFLARLPTPIRDIYILHAVTGLRATELRRVTPSHLAPARRSKERQPSDVEWVLNLRARETKNRRSRTVGLPPIALAAFNRLAAKCAPDERIVQVQQTALVRTCARVCREIGYDQTITPRDMRHWCATTAGLTGDIWSVAGQLGHTETATSGRYGHAVTERMLKTSSVIADELTGVVNGGHGEMDAEDLND